MKNLLSSAWNWFDRILRSVFEFLLKLAGKTITDEQWDAFMQFVKFGLVGAMNTVVDYVTYLIGLKLFTLLRLFGEYAYLAASVLGFIVSFLNMFYWNNKYVFKTKEGETRSVWQSFVKLFLTYSVTGLVIKNLLLSAAVAYLRIPEAIAPIPVLIITIPLNFILSKLWAFRSKKEED